ncbi:MAG: nuclear transport factor 2 family protein [Gemmatimonadota bacterium]|nr:nuclear transport factor 2 family protein [Gemmatimonadota bacterium]
MSMEGEEMHATRPRRCRHAARAALLGGTLLALPGGAAAQGVVDSSAAFQASLIAAEAAASGLAAEAGLGPALVAVGADDLVLVYPGAPVLSGRETVRQFLASQPDTGSQRLHWVPLHAEASSDGTFGVTYGVTGISSRAPDGDSAIRFGKYLSAWVRTPAGWRLAAHAQLHLVDPSAVTVPPGFMAPSPPPPDWARASTAFALADSEFAALAGREGAVVAFTAYAAADAVTFPANGLLTRGPVAIGRAVADEGLPSHWRWRPVAVGGSDRGDLGFTVGEAEIRSGDAAGEGAVYYGKYLTLWRRDADGAYRFLADGGNSRPVPVRP